MSILPDKKLQAVLLGLILVIGLVRIHRIDDPPIGYHSMKEVHYLSIARGYLENGDFLHKRVLYSGMSDGPGYIEGLPQFQFLPLIYFGLWKLFGVKLWIARLVVILFSLAGILMTFLVAKRLTGRKEIPLLAAFFMAILPVSIFFGRNIQPDTPALFFLLLLTWFYLMWLEGFRRRYLFLFSLMAFVTAMVKGTFLIMLVPLVFLFPFGSMKDRKMRIKVFRQALWFLSGIFLIAAWLAFTRITQTSEGSIFPIKRLFLPEAFTITYWKIRLPIVWKYIGENYTYIYFFVFAVGLAGSFLETRERMSRYILGSFFAVIIYFVLISDFAIRHSYYQIPFLPMVCFGIAVTLSDGMAIIGNRVRNRGYLRYILPVLVILASIPSVKKNLDRHFDKQMIGCDVAGRYIKEHGRSDDRVFISFGSPSERRFDAWRTQYYGILWESNKRGNLLPADIERVRFGEKERNMRWIVLFHSKWLDNDRELLDHIHDNYSIRQIGYMDDTLLYYVLEKGGVFDPAPFEDAEKKLARRYRFSSRDIELFVKDAGG